MQPGPGLDAASKAIRDGDLLAFSARGGANPSLADALAAKGGAIQELAA